MNDREVKYFLFTKLDERTLSPMERSLFMRCLALLLMLTLSVGQRAFVPAVAASSDLSGVAMHDMSVMDMSGSQADHHDCCPSPSDKNQGSKGSLCNAPCCAATSQAALPALHPIFVRQATVILVYGHADTISIGRSLPPDYPPPKV